MSRIDEALRRIQGGNEAEPGAVPRQQLFASAWPVSGEEGEAARAEAGPALSRQSGTSPPPAPRGILSFSSRWRERLAAGPQGDPGLIEQFRRLAATLHHAHQANGLRSVMITSASPGDGKTLTAVNLALVLAESYRYKVLLVDADLRRPSIPSVAGLSEGGGLSEVLRATTEQKLALVPITAGLTLLPAGQPIANSIEALISPRMKQIMEEASARFDWIVMDAPPVGPAADARLLAQMVGGTLFVIHAGRTQYDDVQKAIDAVGREQVMGIVLNGVEGDSSEGYYYGTGGPSAKG